jgi:hypothetical protein
MVLLPPANESQLILEHSLLGNPSSLGYLYWNRSYWNCPVSNDWTSIEFVLFEHLSYWLGALCFFSSTLIFARVDNDAVDRWTFEMGQL